MGLPALLTDVPGLEDLRAHFPSLVYCTPDEQGLEQALRALLAQGAEGLQARRSAAGRYPAIVQRNFSAERGAREYGAIYRELARGPKEGTR